MIYTVTFNPALDYVMQADKLNYGATNRSNDEKIFFGGKGINVSVILKEFGINSTPLGFVAGFTGDYLESQLEIRGIKTDFIHLKNGITRINVKLKGDCITEINANGPQIEKSDIQHLFQKLNSLEKGDTLVLAGSVPTCLPKNIYEEILSTLYEKNVRFVVDAEGSLLLETLKYKPFLIKPNEDELSAIFNTAFSSEKDIISSAKELIKKGAQNVLISRGSKGAILLADDGKVYKQHPVKIDAVNTVGAGDSMVAGFLSGTDKDYKTALCYGAAAGVATALTDCLADYRHIKEFISKIEIETIL